MTAKYHQTPSGLLVVALNVENFHDLKNRGIMLVFGSLNLIHEVRRSKGYSFMANLFAGTIDEFHLQTKGFLYDDGWKSNNGWIPLETPPLFERDALSLTAIRSHAFSYLMPGRWTFLCPPRF